MAETLSEFVSKTLGEPVECKTARDCAIDLGWTFTEPEEGEMTEIKCCGELVKLGGWIGCEHAKCSKCGKGMQDMFGLLPGGGCTAGLIDCDKYPEESANHKHWITKTFWN